MKTIILIPAYKPEESFADFSQRLVERGHRVVAVNDGSGPEFDDVFERVAAMGVTVLRHDVNKGKGRALKTGFEYITEHEPDTGLVVTADCDGQHTIPDIERIIATEEEHPDAFVIGGGFAGALDYWRVSQGARNADNILYERPNGTTIIFF